MRRSDFDLYRPLYVTVVYQGKCSHCMRIGVAVPLSGTVARLREAVSMETKIPTDQVVRLLTSITQGPQKCCFLFSWNILTVLCQIWLDRNVKPVASILRK